MTTIIDVTPPAELARQIAIQHDLAFGKAREALEHARRAGELLLEAKAALGHGAWLPWLAVNVGFSERTARGYMRLANHWGELQAKTATVADLGLRDALALLAESKPARRELSSGLQDADDPAEYLRRSMWDEIQRLAPGVQFRTTGMILPENLSFNAWRRIVSILKMLPVESLGPIHMKRAET